MKQEVFNGNNLELLKQYPDNYFDAIVTDPPYGLGKEPNAEQMLQAWITDGYLEVKGSGFMGKEWDAFVPQPIFWKEVFRTLKHGGHVVSFFGTRTYDWGVMAMRLAGFEVRDCIQWVYGSGFPKSHNISKAIDKMYGAERQVVGLVKGMGKQNPEWNGTSKGRSENSLKEEYEKTNPSTDQAKEWEGWGSALKPANEPIVLARKPLEKGLSIAENVLKWGTGGINIDVSRIGFKNEADFKESTQKNQHGDFGTKPLTNNNVYGDYSMIEPKNYEPSGRFPANFIMTHHPDCICVGTKKVKPSNGSGKASENGGGFSKGMFGDGTSDNIGGGFTDENGQETIENWNCHEDCPIRILDEQSGVSKGENKLPYTYELNEYKVEGFINNVKPQSPSNYNDKGGASRFFYCAKASKKERNKGLDSFEDKPLAFSNQEKAELKRGNEQFDGNNSKGHGNSIRHLKNFHPTVKPISLMRYLVRLITPPNGIVLDPFNGSGTTGIACKLEGMNYVGMELDAEYCKIAQARIDNFTESDLKYEVEEQDDVEEVEKTNEVEKNNNQLGLF